MKYFSIRELERSSTADRLGIVNKMNYDTLVNFEAMVDKVLDPIREAWGHPIMVNSGYRCEKLNRAVGGSVTSQHMGKNYAAAVDIEAGTKEQNRRLFILIQRLKNEGKITYDQLINEHKDYSWIHISYKRIGTNRKQTFAL